MSTRDAVFVNGDGRIDVNEMPNEYDTAVHHPAFEWIGNITKQQANVCISPKLATSGDNYGGRVDRASRVQADKGKSKREQWGRGKVGSGKPLNRPAELNNKIIL